jgi:hypothetical protein
MMLLVAKHYIANKNEKILCTLIQRDKFCFERDKVCSVSEKFTITKDKFPDGRDEFYSHRKSSLKLERPFVNFSLVKLEMLI